MDGEPPAAISIRAASPDDRVAVARVLDGALLEVDGLGERLAEGCVLVATADRTADQTADENADDSTAVGGTIVGAIVVAPEGPSERLSPAGWPAAAHLRALAVRRKRRRNGIGAGLVHAALEQWSPIVADFESGVRPFYDALGAECQQGPDGRHWALLRVPKPD